MKKALVTMAAALAVMASVPSISTQAFDQVMKGDLNRDGRVTISDAVIMQKYLLGQYEENFVSHSGYTSCAGDINDDGVIDVYDFILLKQMVETSNDKITKTFTRCADSMPSNMNYGKPSGQGEAVITSVNELKEYFQPYSVMLTTGECVTIEVASQEVIDDYLAQYDKKFFANNVLCLKFLSGTDKYSYQSVQYDDSSLIIKYYDATAPYLCWDDPLPPYIAEVVVPMNLWADGDVVWEEVDPPFTPQIKTEFTTAITSSDIEYAVSNSYPTVIRSVSEFESFIDGKFDYVVQKGLKAEYDENYFNNNVMIFDLYYQGYDKFQTTVDVEKNEYGEIEVIYDILEADGEAVNGLKLSIISIPKDQYHHTAVIRTKTWETPIEASLNDFDVSTLHIDDLWVSSYEEFESLFKEALAPEIYKKINLTAENIDWSKQSAYMWVDRNVIDTNHKLLSASKRENGLDLKLSYKQPFECISNYFLHVVTVDKKYEGSSVSHQTLNLYEDLPMTGGEYVILPFSNNGANIMIGQYAFGDKNAAAIYQLHPGEGVRPFNGYSYLGVIDLPEGFEAFSSLEDYTMTENDDGSITATTTNMTVVNYSNLNDKLQFDRQQVKVSFTIPDSGEIIEKTFSY